MMRSQRKAFPLVALLAFEVAAIVGLQTLGASSAMQIPWGDLNTWLQNGSVDEIAAPVIRLLALGVAYWMFGSTALFAIAQLSRIPSAIRATSAFTLPSVRRVVDGAVAVSIATTSFVGFGATAAMAQPANPDSTIQVSGDLSVPTPIASDQLTSPDAAMDSTPTPGTAAPTAAPTPSSNDAQPGDSSTPGNQGNTGSDTSTTTSSTTTSSTTSTTAAPTPAAPTAGSDWVPTPRPGEATAPSTTTPSTTTTTVPAGPKSAAPATPQTQVLGAQDHRVVAGDNLWTISRDALASSTGRSASDLKEGEIRDYWLKVIDANRSHLRSGDPHWIFPGEVISLPAAS